MVFLINAGFRDSGFNGENKVHPVHPDRPNGRLGDKGGKALGLLMRGSMQGGGREQSNIIGTTKVLHEIIDEHFRRQHPATSIFRGNDNIESIADRANGSRTNKPLKTLPNRNVADIEPLPQFVSGKTIPPQRQQLVNIAI